MREIKFRGLELMSGDWIHGSHIKTGVGLHYIVPQNLIAARLPQYDVDMDTVGQYTGMKDAKGIEIYEGDILQPSNGEKKFYVVVWRDGGFSKKYRFIRKYKGDEWEESSYVPVHADGFKVIGNIYEQDEPMN